MELIVEGRVIELIPEKKGQTKSGKDWKSAEFVIETKGQYPSKIYMQIWNDKVPCPKVGSDLKVYFNPESNKSGENWYTNLRVWKLEDNF